MDVKEPEASTPRRYGRLGVLSRSSTAVDCVGSAVSLSELVRADDDEADSGE